MKKEWTQIDALVGNGADNEDVFAKALDDGRHAVCWCTLYGISGVIFSDNVQVVEEVQGNLGMQDQAAAVGDDYEVVLPIRVGGEVQYISIDSFGDAYLGEDQTDYVDEFEEFEAGEESENFKEAGLCFGF